MTDSISRLDYLNGEACCDCIALRVARHMTNTTKRARANYQYLKWQKPIKKTIPNKHDYVL
jgi:hypothetical protein